MAPIRGTTSKSKDISAEQRVFGGKSGVSNFTAGRKPTGGEGGRARMESGTLRTLERKVQDNDTGSPNGTGGDFFRLMGEGGEWGGGLGGGGWRGVWVLSKKGCWTKSIVLFRCYSIEGKTSSANRSKAKLLLRLKGN